MSKRFDTVLYNPLYRIISHLTFWSIIYIDEILAAFGITPAYEEPYTLLPYVFLDMCLVYLVLYWVIPNFFKKKKYFTFIIITSTIILLDTFLSSYFDFDNGCQDCSYVVYFLEVFLVNSSMFGLAIGFKLFKFFYKENIEVSNLKSLQQETELSFLKNQINPHFLFNALNNLYVMAQKKDQNLPDSILDLSDLLRYQTYDSNKSFVSLKEELNFIKNYIDFERVRRTNLDMIHQVEGQVHQLKIAPLLLLPMAENALKYSITSDDKKMSIQSLVNIEKEEFVYYVSNTIGNKNMVNKTAYSGIGLSNLKRRLALIYPGKHTLDISNDGNIYEIRLGISITELT